MSARLTLSASLAARPQPRSSLRRLVRRGPVPPLAAPRHSALQPSFLTLFFPSLPLSRGQEEAAWVPAALGSRGAPPPPLPFCCFPPCPPSGWPGGGCRAQRRREDRGGRERWVLNAPEPAPSAPGSVQPSLTAAGAWTAPPGPGGLFSLPRPKARVWDTAWGPGRSGPAGVLAPWRPPPISPHDTRSLGSFSPTPSFHHLVICVSCFNLGGARALTPGHFDPTP